jgi:hypothetical protein
MNNLINTDNNCTIKTTTVQYRQQQYNTTKPERNMNNLINTDNNCTIQTTISLIQTTTVQYRQQLYNKDKNCTIKTTTVQ